MFEDSLVESQSRIRTHSRSLAVFSFLAQAALLLLLILYPLFHPQALPRQSIERLLIAPPPPRASAPEQVQHATSPASPQPLPSLLAQLQAPRTIPLAASMTSDGGPPPTSYAGSILGGVPDGIPNGIPLGPATPHDALAEPPAPGSVRCPISSGVAAGQLMSPIRPI